MTKRAMIVWRARAGWVGMMSVGDQRWICRTKLRHRLVDDLWRHGILRRMSAPCRPERGAQHDAALPSPPSAIV